MKWQFFVTILISLFLVSCTEEKSPSHAESVNLSSHTQSSSSEANVDEFAKEKDEECELKEEEKDPFKEVKLDTADEGCEVK